MASKRADDFTGVTEQELFEMANVSPEDTRLSRRIWISANPRGEDRRPRLKVEGTDQKFYPVSIDDPVEFFAGWAPGWSSAEFQDLQQFVALNREVLMVYWKDQIDTKTALNRLRPIQELQGPTRARR
jgi:hypothetical protein